MDVHQNTPSSCFRRQGDAVQTPVCFSTFHLTNTDELSFPPQSHDKVSFIPYVLCTCQVAARLSLAGLYVSSSRSCSPFFFFLTVLYYLLIQCLTYFPSSFEPEDLHCAEALLPVQLFATV